MIKISTPADRAGIPRREALTRLVGLALAGGAWTSEAVAKAVGAAAAGAAPALSAVRTHTLAAAADLIVPATDTPGALQTGVPAFISALHAHWMTADERTVFDNGLDRLDLDARAKHRRGFAACTPAQRTEILRQLRAEQPYGGHTFSIQDRLMDPSAPFFTRLRDLVVFGYFTSQAGTSQELRYIPAPGKFTGDVPMKEWPYQMVL